MPINLYHPLWKEFFKYLGWVLLFAVLWFRGCNRSEIQNSSKKVEVPEVKAKFEAKKPVHVQIITKSVHDTIVMYKKGQNVYMNNPIDKKLITENEKLKSDYAKASDSIKQLSFNNAIQLNKFSTKFEDENVILNINGVVQGEVKEIAPNYIIKKKTVEVTVKPKETVFRLLVGGGIGFNNPMNKAIYKVDLGFQNRKGDIISAEYVRVGNEKYGVIGFKKSIFDIKK